MCCCVAQICTAGVDLIASDVWGVTARHKNVVGRCLGACPY